jgi:hypothetical protein
MSNVRDWLGAKPWRAVAAIPAAVGAAFALPFLVYAICVGAWWEILAVSCLVILTLLASSALAFLAWTYGKWLNDK